MTAGKGVQHCEMFPLLNKEKENTLELFQIWLNLPKSKKMAAPHFAMLWSDAIPTFESKSENGKATWIKVVAGKIENVTAPNPAPNSWAADSSNDVAIWTIKMDAGAKWTLPKASVGVNRSLYFYDGKTIGIAGKDFSTHIAIELMPEETVELLNGDSESSLLLLQGKPIQEPVAQYGPFVMNSQAEIQQAYQEYQQTQFGGWPWPSYEHVHPRENGRFAKYPDGKVETRD